MPIRSRHASTLRPRAFTLIELLVVITILGIAGVMVIPAMANAGILRVQGAVRAISSDIMFAQSDAVAFQEYRALRFDPAGDRYRVLRPTGNTINIATDTMYDPSSPNGLYEVGLGGDLFGGTSIVSAEFGESGGPDLIFDALGGPVDALGDNTPGIGGTILLQGGLGQRFEISVAAFTGRVTVERLPDEDPEEDD